MPPQKEDELMLKLKREKKVAREYVERRYQNWNDNYELYRNKVRTNRLTQRQTVNIPLMKETIKTLISKIDDAPIIEWRELSGDEGKEIVFQEIWNRDYERLNLELIDVQDKKTVMLYGRAFRKFNWVDNELAVTPLDIYDVIVDPLTNPIDLETARFVIHQNIYRSLREILTDDRYESDGKEKLKIWATSQDAIVQSAQNKKDIEDRAERLKAMGLDNKEFATWGAGDVIVNLTEHYTKFWNGKEFEKRVVVYAEDTIKLLDEKIEDLLGIDFYPFVTWAEDVETQDFWSDSIADLIRTPNQILNIWFSQLVENRTLRNFQMHWYDATVQGYTPQTYEPGPGRMLPAPGDPNKTIMPVDIQGLDETLTAIQFLTGVIERSTAATAIEKGTGEKRQATLGEIQILVGKATERTISMEKMYRRAWQEFCQKYYKIVEANASGKSTLYKSGSNGKLWPKVVYASDWRSTAGYKPIVTSTSEHENDQTKGVQKFQFILQQFPNNLALKRISQKRMLELVDLTPQEMREVQDAEKQMEKQPELGGEAIPGTLGIQQPIPSPTQQPQLV